MKSQLEKFEARRAKMRRDEEAIRLGKQEQQQTTEQKATKAAEELGVSTEDIFFIITREGSKGFVNMWNNSMESVINNKFLEVREIVREVVQQELAAAYKGIIRGLTEPQQTISTQDIKNIVEELIVEEKVEAEKQAATAIEETEILNVDTLDFPNKEELDKAIIEALNEGIDPTVGLKFKKSGSRRNGLYQMFAKRFKGQSGLWQKYTENVLKNNQ